MRKLAITTMVAFLAAACGGAASTSAPTAGPTGPKGAAEARPVDPRKGGFDVGFGEFAITLEAKTIRPGPVTLVVHNGGKLVHGFEMKAEGEGASGRGRGGGDRFELEEPTFGPGDTIRIRADLPAGLYEIECYVANHEALGMRVALQVRSDPPLVRPQPGAPGDVLIQGFAFSPKTVEVETGTAVSWKNIDPTEHTVTARDGSFSSEPLADGRGFRVMFDRAGRYAYSCAIHPTMTGTVEVTG